MTSSLIIPPPGTKVVQSFKIGQAIEVGMYKGTVGDYCIVTRDGRKVKGMLCLSELQACDMFAVCVKKVRSKYIRN